MKKITRSLKLAGLLLLSLMLGNIALAQQPPDNVEGNWIIYAPNIDNNEVVVKHVQIAQFGNRITGHFDGPNQSGPIEGVVNGHRVRFSTVTKNVLHFGGEIFGDTMNGSVGIRGRRSSWEAIRTTASPQDYPTGTVLSAMPMLVTNQPVPQPAPAPQYVEPAPAPQAASPSAQTTDQSAPQSDSQSTPDTTDNSQDELRSGTCASDARPTQRARRTDCALSRRARRPNPRSRRLPRTDRVRRLLDVAEQILDRNSANASGKQRTLGFQREGTHSISFRPP